jgi:hypothetical protein
MVPVALFGFHFFGFTGLVIGITVLNSGAMLGLLFVSPRFLDAGMGRLVATLLAPLPAGLAALLATRGIEAAVATPWLRLVLGVPAGLVTFMATWELSCRAPLGNLERASILRLLLRVLRRDPAVADDDAEGSSGDTAVAAPAESATATPSDPRA